MIRKQRCDQCGWHTPVRTRRPDGLYLVIRGVSVLVAADVVAAWSALVRLPGADSREIAEAIVSAAAGGPKDE